MKKMKFYVILVVVMVNFLGACQSKDTIPETTITPTETVSELPTPESTEPPVPTNSKNITSIEKIRPNKTYVKQEAKIIPYHLGTNKIEVNNDGRKKEYPIAGWLGIPEQEHAPVVFIIHGSHMLDLDKETLLKADYAGGFSYLIQALAEQGYLVISINVNRSYTWILEDGDEIGEDQDEFALSLAAFWDSFNALMQANNGEDKFGIDLTNKADFSKINLIGHSKGGEFIQVAAGALQEKEGKKPLTLLQIAPSLNLFDLQEQADIPTAIILPQYDGDVYYLDGNKYFLNAENKSWDSPIMTLFLFQAKHVPFNKLASKYMDNDYNDSIENLLSIKQHQQLLTRFTLDFLNSQNRWNVSLTNLMHSETANEYESNFSFTIYDPSGTDLLRKPNADKKGINSKSLELEYVIASSKKNENTAGLFHFPGEDIFSLGMYSIRWKQENGSVIIPIESDRKDFSKYKKLALTIALNSTEDAFVSTKTATEFDVVIEDNNGEKKSVKLSSLKDHALKYQWGRILPASPGFGYEVDLWSQYTPFGTQLIDLSEFNGIDFTNIKSISLITRSKTGSIMLDSVVLYQ